MQNRNQRASFRQPRNFGDRQYVTRKSLRAFTTKHLIALYILLIASMLATTVLIGLVVKYWR